MSFLNHKIKEIKRLCVEHKVSKLFVFGSFVKGNFTSDSDIDFVVDFDSIDLMNYADNYFSLKSSLEKLLDKPVDLLEQKALKNPYLLKEINAHKKLIYGR